MDFPQLLLSGKNALQKTSCTTHNNISPCTNDGVINSPVSLTSIFSSPGGDALPPLDKVERALLSVDCGTSLSGNMYGTGGKWETSESVHVGNVRSYPPTQENKGGYKVTRGQK